MTKPDADSEEAARLLYQYYNQDHETDTEDYSTINPTLTLEWAEVTSEFIKKTWPSYPYNRLGLPPYDERVRVTLYCKLLHQLLDQLLEVIVKSKEAKP